LIDWQLTFKILRGVKGSFLVVFSICFDVDEWTGFGMFCSQHQIQNLVDSTKPDVIITTETWLDPTITNSQIFTPNYNIYRKDRKGTKTGGGVLIAINDKYLSSEIPELDTDCEIIWCKIQQNHIHFSINNVVVNLDNLLSGDLRCFYFWLVLVQVVSIHDHQLINTFYTKYVKGRTNYHG
jgi:hypothetical protein